MFNLRVSGAGWEPDRDALPRGRVSRTPMMSWSPASGRAARSHVIMTAQSAQDAPFDVAHTRHVRYLPNGEGMRQLQDEVQRLLEALRGRR